jgi:hypothetical protein
MVNPDFIKRTLIGYFAPLLAIVRLIKMRRLNYWRQLLVLSRYGFWRTPLVIRVHESNKQGEVR